MEKLGPNTPNIPKHGQEYNIQKIIQILQCYISYSNEKKPEGQIIAILGYLGYQDNLRQPGTSALISLGLHIFKKLVMYFGLCESYLVFQGREDHLLEAFLCR